MATRQQLVNELLSAAAARRLNVIGMNVEPLAALDCFNQLPGFKTAEKDPDLRRHRVQRHAQFYIVPQGRMLFARSPSTWAAST